MSTNKGSPNIEPISEKPTDAPKPALEAPLVTLEREYGATWDSESDPHDPYNWPAWRKISIGILVSAGQLVTLMSASVMAAALPQIAEDLNIAISVTQITFSIYLLGLGFAPFLIAALSEIYGRKPVWVASNAWYIIWNALCPVGKSAELMIAGRLLAGCGASAGVALTGPIMADMYRAHQRGKSLAIASLLPYLGPALGPIIGGTVSDLIEWPWLFWVLSIFDLAITLLGCFLLAETYTPVLIRRKARRENPQMYPPLSPVTAKFYHDFLYRLSTGLYRPVRMLIKRPTMQLIAFQYGLNFGIYTFTLSTFAALWIDGYHQSELTSSLHYIAIAIGSTLAAQAGGPIMDLIWRRLRARYPHPSPEFRVPFMVPSAILVAVGLFWYGWAAESRSPWPLVDTGCIIFVCGSFMHSMALLAYLLDEFKHIASANAAARLLSYIFGFAFPIFGPNIYSRLGYGWGNSLMALIWIVLGIPPIFIFHKFGARLRAVRKSEDG